MTISRDNQLILADTALRLLARGICAVSMLDKRVAADVDTLGNGFSFAVCAGLGEKAPTVRLLTENGRFVRAAADSGDSDVTIRFKDVTGLIPVITGKKSVESAFAQHRMLVWGSINQAVMLVRIISIAETYLFPKLMIKKAMRRVPKKQVPSLFIYITLPFFGVRKPQTALPEPGALPEIVEDVSETEQEIRPEIESVTEQESAAEAEVEIEQEVSPKIETETEQEPIQEIEPEPKPEIEKKAQAKSKAKSRSKSKSKSKAKAKAKAKTETKTEAATEAEQEERLEAVK